MLTKEELINQIKNNKRKLFQFGVKRIGLFGSYVRGEQTDESDIDFVVEFQKGKKNFDNFMHLSFYLESLLEKKVELLTEKSISPYFKPYIIEETEYVEI